MAPELATKYVFTLTVRIGDVTSAGEIGHGVRRIILVGYAIRPSHAVCALQVKAIQQLHVFDTFHQFLGGCSQHIGDNGHAAPVERGHTGIS